MAETRPRLHVHCKQCQTALASMTSMTRCAAARGVHTAAATSLTRHETVGC